MNNASPVDLGMEGHRSSWAWAPHLLSIELKKALHYRVTFWIDFVFGTTAEMAVAYFVWKAVFEVRGVETLSGFSFSGLIYYYLFASVSSRIARGSERGYLAQDIYDGGLTRYLLYPLSFFGFKYITHVTQQILGVFQLVVALIAVWTLLGTPPELQLNLGHVLAGIATCMLAGYLHFVLVSCLELVAFWQEVVWNLLTMLRFMVGLLGGGMIPLAFFPEWGQKVAALTPFPSIVAFPVKTFLGQITPTEWLASALQLVIWSVVFTLIAMAIWSKGSKRYTGVGI